MLVQIHPVLVENVDGQQYGLERLFANMNIFSGDPGTPSIGFPVVLLLSVLTALNGAWDEKNVYSSSSGTNGTSSGPPNQLSLFPDLRQIPS